MNLNRVIVQNFITKIKIWLAEPISYDNNRYAVLAASYSIEIKLTKKKKIE